MSEKGKIKVIIPFHNPGNYFDMCINSVLTQDFEGFDILFIDDGSTDDSYSKIPACVYKTDEKGEPIKDENNHLVIEEKHPLLEITKCDIINAWKASERLTALPNIHNGIMNFSNNPDDIIVILYGDDWFSGKNALQRIYGEYESTGCLFTYGSARLSDGRKSYSSQYSEKEFDHLRITTPKFSHPLTFKRSLYNKLLEKDEKLESFTDSKGEWFSVASNYAIAYPLMELAGFSNVRCIKDILYTYNVENPLNSEKMNPDLYYSVLDTIQSRKSMNEKPNEENENTDN